MPGVEIYTWQNCPYCRRAKEIFEQYNVEYTEHKIDGDEEARNDMTRRTGGHRSLPQIFKDDDLVGGCHSLIDLVEDGTFKEVFEDYIAD